MVDSGFAVSILRLTPNPKPNRPRTRFDGATMNEALCVSDIGTSVQHGQTDLPFFCLRSSPQRLETLGF